MTRLPVLSARKILKALRKAGFVIVRQPRGSHVILARPGSNAEVTVPMKRTIKRGTMRSILRQAGLSETEFRDLF